MDVVVLDERGEPVRGLAREDFRLFEDGRPQEIVSFEAFLGGAEEELVVPPAVGDLLSPRYVASRSYPAAARVSV